MTDKIKPYESTTIKIDFPAKVLLPPVHTTTGYVIYNTVDKKIVHIDPHKKTAELMLGILNKKYNTSTIFRIHEIHFVQ